MSAQSTKRLEVIAIKRLDTVALRRLRAEVESARSTAPIPGAPPVVVRAPATRRAQNGRRRAMATFALGLFLGVLSSRLGENGQPPTFAPPAQLASDPPAPPAETAPPVAAPTAVVVSGAPSEAPKTTPPPPPAAKPAHHHHHSSGSTAQITVEPSVTRSVANGADAESAGK